MIDETLEFWGKFQRHKCKQRLTKLHQMIIRQRKLRISDSHTQEQLVRINKKYEKRETNREASALKAAQVERAIEKELLNRLKLGTFYKNIHNLDQKNFEDQLEKNEVNDQTEQEIMYEEDFEEEEDDSEIGGDLESITSDQQKLLDMAEASDDADFNDIENLDQKILGKKRKPAVKIRMEDEIELEYENEDSVVKPSKKLQKISQKSNK